jgi:hypothetical protein
VQLHRADDDGNADAVGGQCRDIARVDEHGHHGADGYEHAVSAAYDLLLWPIVETAGGVWEYRESRGACSTSANGVDQLACGACDLM